MTRVWYLGERVSTSPDPAMRTLMDATSGNFPRERPVAQTMGTPRHATSIAGSPPGTENPHGFVPSFASR